MRKREVLAKLENAELDATRWHNLYYKRAESIRVLKDQLVKNEAENKSLKRQLTVARRNLASEENKHKQESLYRALHDQRELEELRHQNTLLRDLITSQGVIISEVFNR